MLDYLLRFEYWLDNRSSSRELYRMNDHDLADIGLSKADVEGLNGAFWGNPCILPIHRLRDRR